MPIGQRTFRAIHHGARAAGPAPWPQDHLGHGPGPNIAWARGPWATKYGHGACPMSCGRSHVPWPVLCPMAGPMSHGMSYVLCLRHVLCPTACPMSYVPWSVLCPMACPMSYGMSAHSMSCGPWVGFLQRCQVLIQKRGQRIREVIV